jgi:hypothetical protein
MVAMLLAVPPICLYIAFRRINFERFIPRMGIGLLGILLGIISTIATFRHILPGALPTPELNVLLFFVLFPASGFFAAWEWREVTFFWPIILAVGNALLNCYFDKGPYSDAGWIVGIAAFLLSLTGYSSGLKARRDKI